MLFVQYYFRTTISSGIKWARYVACMETGDKHVGFWFETLKERNNFKFWE